tara:strand:- start:6276 stop:7148 length:873 start_codon:yes stop_codon:yes gene_type:complete
MLDKLDDACYNGPIAATTIVAANERQTKERTTMCLLIANPEQKPIDLEIFETATESNPDGFGVSFIRKGKAVIKKAVTIDPAKQREMCEKFGWPPLMHWRYSTSGGNCGKFTHPFRLSPTTTLAHNGVLPIKISKGLSDTATLVGNLRKSPFTAVAKLRQHNFKGNKFIVLNTKRLHIVGEEQGTWLDGVWYSNETGFESRYAKYYTPTNKSGRNYYDQWRDNDGDDDAAINDIQSHEDTSHNLGYIDKAVDTLNEEIEWTLAGRLSHIQRTALVNMQEALEDYHVARGV